MDKKYLKYKTKYLQLQQQSGNGLVKDPKTLIQGISKLGKSKLGKSVASALPKIAKATQNIVGNAVDGAEVLMKKVATGAQKFQDDAERQLIIKILNRLIEQYKTPDSHLNKPSSKTDKDSINKLLMEIYNIINKEMNSSVTAAITKVTNSLVDTNNNNTKIVIDPLLKDLLIKLLNRLDIKENKEAQELITKLSNLI